MKTSITTLTRKDLWSLLNSITWKEGIAVEWDVYIALIDTKTWKNHDVPRYLPNKIQPGKNLSDHERVLF